MNPDDFEQQLQRQALQPPPAAWREEILQAARANIPTAVSGRESELLTGWRALLARIPLAWGAVAALWLVILGVNSFMAGPAIATIASTSAPAPRDAMTVWNLQRTGESLLANRLTDGPDLVPFQAQPTAPPRPRSDRRRDDGFGTFYPEANIQTIA